jgi:hypothetical protein
MTSDGRCTSSHIIRCDDLLSDQKSEVTYIVQVTAPHFVAGAVFDTYGDCIQAAPIIKWMVGKHFNEINSYVKPKGWTVRWIKE